MNKPYKLFNSESPNNIPYILCAAIWYKDGLKHVRQPLNITTGYVICGRRHYNCIHNNFYFTKEKTPIETSIQGFLTSDDQFVDRIQAAKIAWANKQTNKELPYLFSEDLY